MTFYLFLIPLIVVLVKADVEMAMYQDNNFQGGYLTLTLGNSCVDLLAEFNDLTNSVNTNGGCAMLCKDYGCKGGCMKMEPGVAGWDNLGSIGWGNTISSVKDCTEKTNQVSLYWDSNFKGKQYDYTLVGDECKNVDAGFNDQASSVNTHNGCVMLYADYGCQGKSVEMKPGVAGWDFLGNVGFNDVLSSMRNC